MISSLSFTCCVEHALQPDRLEYQKMSTDIAVFVVPLILKYCADVIESHGIVDGIYRLSGVASNIQKLRCVSRGADVCE